MAANGNGEFVLGMAGGDLSALLVDLSGLEFGNAVLSALGMPKPLCEIDAAGLRFIVPLRADTGFAQRYLDEIGPDALRSVRYVAERERRLPRKRQTKYRGAIRDWEVEDPAAGQPRIIISSALNVTFLTKPPAYTKRALGAGRVLTSVTSPRS